MSTRHRHRAGNGKDLDVLDEVDSDDLDTRPGPVSGRGAAYRVIPLKTPVAREAALIGARMLVGTGWYSRLFSGRRLHDDGVLTLLGLEEAEHAEGDVGPHELRRAVEAQLRRLERRRPRRDRIGANVERFGELLRLGKTERALVRAMAIASCADYMSDLYRLLVTCEEDFLRAMSHATGCRRCDIASAWRSSARLRSSGLVEEQIHGLNFPPGLERTVAERLLAPSFDADALLRHLVRAAPAPTLSPADFAHLRDAALIIRYLERAIGARRRGVNVLIHGAPGTGKTEFVRMLAGPLRVAVSEVPNVDDDGDPISGRQRFSAYATCQNLLAGRRRQLLFFDEVEDVFGVGGEGLFGALLLSLRQRDPECLRKSWVNEMLENNPVPAIWACNTIGAMDPAFLRRFDMVVEFRAPSEAARRGMVQRCFARGELSPACVARLAAIRDLTPAQVERAARVVKALRLPHQAERDAAVERLVDTSLRAMGIRTTHASALLPDHYDPAFLNADCDLDRLARGLARGHGARLCLYGPPGTGKTAFAHHLGRTLDRPVLVRRASDLLDMYIGRTEQRIRAAFAEAADTGSILVIDEADGFLRDRSGAARLWEVTHVNELLTGMEAFDGLFIASTNLVETLDAASLRRFDFKIRFDAMNREQRRAMLLCVLADVRETPEVRDDALRRLDRLEHLTPGEVRTAKKVVDLLACEQSMKPVARRRGIGFVAG